mmetsp:Transcript_20724/g.31361  ORF Transcript_20724/g.31361 Transcript_20724/m.31361 type:complete len:470 (+) Transcript_20724:110-1519(+)
MVVLNRSFSSSSPHGKSLECDYDIDPTYLYQAIEAKQWLHAIKYFSETDALKEASTWVVRKEANGKLRWRLLPLHAAIIFQSPVEIVELLLRAYSAGAQQKDDQGMLPLHLAFRNGSEWDVLEELLIAFPQATSVKDRKGRIPIQCASSKEFSVVELYTRIAASTERQKAVAESRHIIESRLTALKDTHTQSLTNLKTEWEKQEFLLKEELEEAQRALEVTTFRLEETTELLSQKSTTEAELTQKLELVTDALQMLNEKRLKEESEERIRMSKQMGVLQMANEELRKLVQNLIDQQSSLKSHLDSEGAQTQSHMTKTEKLLQDMQSREEKALGKSQKVRDLWRSRLTDSNAKATAKLRAIIEMASKSVDLQAPKPSFASSQGAKTLTLSRPDIRPLVRASSPTMISPLKPANSATSLVKSRPDVRPLVRAPSPPVSSPPPLKPAMKTSSALQPSSPIILSKTTTGTATK